MNVAIVCPYSMARPGGVQEHARGLAAGLARLGCQVFLFGPDLENSDPPSGVVPISLGASVRIPANGSVAPVGIDPRMFIRLELALDPADVIHVHEPFVPCSLVAILRAPRHMAVVGTFHASADRSLPYAIASPLLRGIARRMHATAAVSPAARELARRYVGAEATIVPNGIDAQAYLSAEPDPWASSLGRTVLFVGRPEPRKGFDVARRAFAAAARQFDDVHLVCIPATESDMGDPPPMLRGRVHALGPVSHERKLSLYRSASVVMVPSLGGESFGLVVIEGLAAGAAVLASDIPGYRFSGSDAALYLPAGDAAAWAAALIQVLGDGDRMAALRAAGPPRAREFDWGVVAERTLGVYRDVLPERGAWMR